MKLYSFSRGGLRFNDRTVPHPASPSLTAFLPAISVISLAQHAGARALPLVNAGDLVREGMLIGRGGGPGSANIHASVPGRVLQTASWKNSEGRINEGLVIRMGGSFEKLGRPEEIFSWEGRSPLEIREAISECGIVEMEGSGRPLSDVFLALQAVREPRTLVVRCVFDDPWLAADQALCMERAAAVAEGCRIAVRAGGMRRVVFAVSQNEKKLGAALVEKTRNSLFSVDMVLTGSRYPQRNDRELETVLRSWAEKRGDDLGIIVFLGPATLAAVYDAVRFKKPILERYVAVGGSAVQNPRVMKARIGTRIGEIFEECGGFTAKPFRIGTGSPLMGQRVLDLDEPITKTSYAVFALLKSQTGSQTRSRCIGCGECRAVCPVGLDPEALFKRIRKDKIVPDRAAECNGCGCCELVCPSLLPLGTSIVRSAEQEKRK